MDPEKTANDDSIPSLVGRMDANCLPLWCRSTILFDGQRGSMPDIKRTNRVCCVQTPKIYDRGTDTRLMGRCLVRVAVAFKSNSRVFLTGSTAVLIGDCRPCHVMWAPSEELDHIINAAIFRSHY